MRTALRTILQRACKDEGGNFALMFGAASSVLVVAVGMAVNYAQLSMTRSNLLNALDAAVTSTARDITTGVIKKNDSREMVLAFLGANAETGFADVGSLSLDALDLDETTNRLSARASVDVPLAFPVFTTASTQRVTVDSAALYSDRRIEVSMMLDVTGSMAGQKIEDLKTAAANAVETFLGSQAPSTPRVRIAIVPYADAVNTGDLVRYVHNETSFTTGAAPAFDPLIYVSEENGGDDMVVSGGITRKDRCATERKGALKFSDASPLEGMISRDVRLGFCPDAELQPLTADKDSLLDTINSFKASGFTAGGIGVQWARYMLSPDWADVLPADSAPTAYKAKKTAKFAILMTDGEFNTAFAGVARNGDVHNQSNRSRNAAEEHCRQMKADGIEVFTIGFMLKETAAKQVMRACASDDTAAIAHYYEVASGEALDAAFQSIAANIERLAIVK